MTEPFLKLTGIGKSYGDVNAAKDIDLDIAAGEFITFLGPSGSGKTTTLMMVAGFIEPGEGWIALEGKSLDPVPVYKRDIGMVFQHYALFPHMNVNQNVAFPLEMRGIGKPERQARVHETLDLVGLTGFGHRFPKELSGGQQQRVALARAMVFRPRLLLMDEPLGALDKKLRGRMQLEIMHLHRNIETTILYVTHDQEEALVMSDRIAVFNQGRIEQIGKPHDLYEEPRTRFVADFIGEINFIAGHASGIGNGSATIRGLRGQIVDKLSEGQSAVLAIRPERLHVVNGHALAEDDNRIGGYVKELIYLGQSRKAIIATDDGTELVALEQAAKAEETALTVGAYATLSFRSRDARLLADDRDV